MIERRKGTPVPSLRSPHANPYIADSFVYSLDLLLFRIMRDQLKQLAEALFAYGGLFSADDQAGYAHHPVLLFQRREQADIIDLRPDLLVDGGNLLGSRHHIRAHAAGEGDQNLHADRTGDGFDFPLRLRVQLLPRPGSVKQPQDKGGKLMPSRNAVKTYSGVFKNTPE